MAYDGSRPSLCPVPIHPDSESGLQWAAQAFVPGPASGIATSREPLDISRGARRSRNPLYRFSLSSVMNCFIAGERTRLFL
jgi:hypothetical protein